MIAMTLFAAVGGLAPSAEAQAAHFSYAQAYVNIHFDVLTGIAVDGSGNVFVTDQGAVYEIPPLGGYATFRTILDLTDLFGGPLPPNYLVISGIAVDGNGDVFLCTSGTAGGIVLEIPAAAGPPVTLPFGPFSQPMSIAADGSGNLFVGDHMALYEIPAAAATPRSALFTEARSSERMVLVLLASRWTGAGTSFFPPKPRILLR